MSEIPLQRVLIIGGAGFWARATYLPAIGGAAQSWHISALADLPDAIESLLGSDLYPEDVRRGAPTLIPLSGKTDDDLKVLESAIATDMPDLIVICSPPETHFSYLQWALNKGCDVVCDKPIVALAQQFASPVASETLRTQYAIVRAAQARSRHWRHQARSCLVFHPLRRREQWPFGDLLHWMHDIRERACIPPTFLEINFNDGAYRFPEEYALPGAHGYLNGLGILTHTGYHVLDFIAAALDCAADPMTDVKCRLLHWEDPASTDTPVDQVLRSVLGDAQPISAQRRAVSVPRPTEIDIVLQYRITFRSGVQTHVIASLLHRGTTRRLSPMYADSATHDEARVEDTSIVAHQGPFQTVQCLITDNEGGAMPNGYYRTVRRLHPTLAQQIGCAEIEVTDRSTCSDEAASFYRAWVGRVLDACAKPTITEDAELETYTLANQAMTMVLYTLALDPIAKGSWASAAPLDEREDGV